MKVLLIRRWVWKESEEEDMFEKYTKFLSTET
jgi:hypothetical protein